MNDPHSLNCREAGGCDVFYATAASNEIQSAVVSVSKPQNVGPSGNSCDRGERPAFRSTQKVDLAHLEIGHHSPRRDSDKFGISIDRSRHDRSEIMIDLQDGLAVRFG